MKQGAIHELEGAPSPSYLLIHPCVNSQLLARYNKCKNGYGLKNLSSFILNILYNPVKISVDSNSNFEENTFIMMVLEINNKVIVI